ncbi:hypothetical protein DLE60_31935, partial [Micromonospora globispora]
HRPAGARSFIRTRCPGTTSAHQLAATYPPGVCRMAHSQNSLGNGATDYIEAVRIVRRLVDSVPAGSFLVVSHPTREVNPEAVDRALDMWNDGGAATMAVRTPQQIARYFDGLEILEPGLVTCSRWRPDGNDTTPTSEYSAVGRKVA